MTEVPPSSSPQKRVRPRPTQDFAWLQKLGGVTQPEMDRVFNGGVGFVVVCRPAVADAVMKSLGEGSVIGEVLEGEAGVEMV